MNNKPEPAKASPDLTREALAEVAQAISELKFGEVTVVMHQGQIQEVRTLKRRRLS